MLEVVEVEERKRYISLKDWSVLCGVLRYRILLRSVGQECLPVFSFSCAVAVFFLLSFFLFTYMCCYMFCDCSLSPPTPPFAHLSAAVRRRKHTAHARQSCS